MARNWPIVKVGELADSVSETHRLEKKQLIFLNTSDILLGRFLHHTYTEVQNWPGQAKKSISKNDILFSEIRPANGRWAFVDHEAVDYVVSTKLMVIRARSHKANSRFLYHFLTSGITTGWLQHLAESRSGTFPQITFDQIAELEIPIPPLGVQASIAAFIDALDDKIELNRRMNETLEAMARTLFKSWFIDFDPVRAKADGRKPEGMDDATARLFPDSFEELEAGLIPAGWRSESIRECCTQVQNGGTPRRDEPRYWNGGTIPWLTSGEVRQPVITSTENFITDVGLADSSAKWLPANTTVVALYGATAGQVSYVAIPVTTNQAVCALVPKDGFASFNYLTMRAATSDLESKAVGSAQQNISKGIVEESQVILPSSPIIEKFSVVTSGYLDRWVANLRESRTLASLRDSLLPKLLSGELRIKDAERFVEANA